MDDHSSSQNNPYLAPKATENDISINPPGGIVLAERLSRLVANLLDNLILSFVIGFIPLVFFLSVKPNMAAVTRWMSVNQFLANVLALVILVAVVGIFLAINFRSLRDNGQTIGKRICNIKIVRSNGSPADVQRILLYRYLPVILISLISNIGEIIAFVGILLIFRESRQCLHDNIADTIVIKA